MWYTIMVLWSVDLYLVFTRINGPKHTILDWSIMYIENHFSTERFRAQIDRLSIENKTACHYIV